MYFKIHSDIVTKKVEAAEKAGYKIAGLVPFDGHEDQLRELVAEEIRLYRDHFAKDAI